MCRLFERKQGDSLNKAFFKEEIRWKIMEICILVKIPGT